MRFHLLAASVILLASTTAAEAATLRVTVTKIDANGSGATLGTVTFKDTKEGLLIEPSLAGLPAGQHGFHVHEKADCDPAEANGQKAAGMAAAGHFDPAHTGKHRGPESTDGHKGDLPVLVVDADGKASLPSLAPHLKVSDLHGHALMIHAGGDNYDDTPAPLGGGGARIACGVIK